MSEPRLVIAIDFGTHASGFAFASVDERARPPSERDMTLYRDWPGGQVFKYFKTRTALLRSSSGEILAWGNDACLEHGLQRRRGRADRLQLREGFKLELTSSDGALRGQATKDAVDYLRLLRETALTVVRGQGFSVPEDQISWCITMPIVVAPGLEGYDSVLRDEVTGPAGFPATDRENLILVAEPEAAALYCQAERSGTGFGTPGERFTVIDAGGGTVDITTLEVNDDFSLDQIGFQAGGKLGSRILNEKFRDMLLMRLRKRHGWEQNASPNPEDWATILTNWEEDKRSWDFAGHDTYHVRIPRRTGERGRSSADTTIQGSDGGDLEMSSEEIRSEVFEPVVPNILRELDKALADLPEGRPVGRVLLVGGFGGSPYLQRQLEEHLAGRALLATLPDPKSAEAVLRGAIHYRLNPKSIHARRMQYTYACDIFKPCTRPQEQHQTEHRRLRFTRWGEEHEYCLQLLVFAHRGEVIKAGTVRKAGALYPADCRQRTVSFRLFASDDPDPYFTERCKLLGSVELPTKIPWWHSIFWRPIDVKVTLGESELIFYAGDRRRPEIYREIRLHYFEEKL